MKEYYKGRYFIVRSSRIKWWSFILKTCEGEDYEYSKQKFLVTFRLRKRGYKYGRYKVYNRLDKNFHKIDDIIDMNEQNRRYH